MEVGVDQLGKSGQADGLVFGKFNSDAFVMLCDCRSVVEGKRCWSLINLEGFTLISPQRYRRNLWPWESLGPPGSHH